MKATSLLLFPLLLTLEACASGAANTSTQVLDFAKKLRENPSLVAERGGNPEFGKRTQALTVEVAKLPSGLPDEVFNQLTQAQTDLGQSLGKQFTTVDFLRFQYYLGRAVSRAVASQSKQWEAQIASGNAGQLASLLAGMQTTLAAALKATEDFRLLQVKFALATNISAYDNHKSRMAAWQAIKEIRAENPLAFTQEGPKLALRENLEKEEDPLVKSFAQEVVMAVESYKRE